MLILIHYGEIGLKKGNRAFFERKLVENIQAALEGCGDFFVTRETGRIIASENNNTVNNIEKIAGKLKKVFGIAHFSFAYEYPIINRGGIESAVNGLCEKIYNIYKNRNMETGNKTFRIKTQRSDKKFPLTSQKLNEQIGDFMVKKTGMKVDLENSDLTIFAEITRKSAYVYFEKIKGPGGLPVGTNGEVLTLISSGIDSPVAAWYLMKRGARANFIHFHSYPQTNKASIDNVKEIIGRLNGWQMKNCKLFLIPLLEIQKDIIKKAPEDYRVMMYRYFMLILAEKLARDNGCKALVTGESLGQVASQTIDNIFALDGFVGMPIFRPLIGMDKEEIIIKAKNIETYGISIRPYGDCCSFFVPKHPVTKANSGMILNVAEKIDKKIIDQAFNNIEIIDF
ncbi:MAG: tRNA 4-thiouridine(8) synthase ThiI [Parcubacteria group bacterium GW2011_GWA2_38_13b]|nr:MAG: tRNA 4-thiouridine(8) synthase ThiI [Parcubacteria group bacterium GW2011_GWA2_38_13b]